MTAIADTTSAPAAQATTTSTKASTTTPIDPKIRFNGEVNLGDILTSLSLLIAALTFVIGVVKERRLRRREYADRVRAAASRAAVAIIRRREIALSFYDALQPAITKADMKIVKTKDAIAGRDQLWSDAVTIRYDLEKRSLDEKVEEAYAGLYEYDIRIRHLFTDTMRILRGIDDDGYSHWLDVSQDVLFDVAEKVNEYQSADFGNPLREACNDTRVTVAAGMEGTVTAFETRMAAIIQSSDIDILKGRLPALGGAV